MSWRRFVVLIRGLSPVSATTNALRVGHVASGRPVRTIDDPKAIDASFASTFGGGRRKPAAN